MLQVRPSLPSTIQTAGIILVYSFHPIQRSSFERERIVSNYISYLTETFEIRTVISSWLSSLFYFGYLFFEYPTTLLSQKFPMGRFVGIAIIASPCSLHLCPCSWLYPCVGLGWHSDLYRGCSQFCWNGRTQSCPWRVSFAPCLVENKRLERMSLASSPSSHRLLYWSTECIIPAKNKFYAPVSLFILLLILLLTSRNAGAWAAANGFGAMVGGIIAFGMGHVNTGIPGWKVVI